jgi:hypothetical protein
MKVGNSIAVCLNAMLLIFLQSQAAEQALTGINKELENKVIIKNVSGYPIEIMVSGENPSDSKYSLRLANDVYQTIGNLSVDDVLKKKLVIEVGHSKAGLAKGEIKGRIPLYELIAREKAAHKDIPGKAFCVMIKNPEYKGIIGWRYSNWTESFTGYFEYAGYAVYKDKAEAEQQLPPNAYPYDIRDFRGVYDAIDKTLGGVTPSWGKVIERYASIEDLRENDNIRWARLVLGLPRNFSKEMALIRYGVLSQRYSPANYLKYYPQTTPQEIVLLNKVQDILTYAKNVAWGNATITY